MIAGLFALVFSLLTGGVPLADAGGCLVAVAPFVTFWNRLGPEPATKYLFCGVMLALYGLNAVCVLVLDLPIIETLTLIGTMAGITTSALYDWGAPASAVAAAQQLRQVQESQQVQEVKPASRPSGIDVKRSAVIPLLLTGILILSAMWRMKGRRQP
jgi:hypothetical protein